MRRPGRPHVLGIDDGPFEKREGGAVPLVAVMTEGSDLVEAVAVGEFPVDGEGITEFLVGWISGMRLRPALQAVMLGGITIAGLAVVDVRRLARELSLPVLVVNRRDPSGHRLHEALASAGLAQRSPLVDETPPAQSVDQRVFVAVAGADTGQAADLVRATRGKSELPEPLRLAHLFAHALVKGQSRGRP